MELTELERAVLDVIAQQAHEPEGALAAQLASATAIRRENSGAGFYTTLLVDPGSPPTKLPSPFGDAEAQVLGVRHGMGFLLWLQDGHAERLEAYTYDDSTSDLDLMSLRFSWVGSSGDAPLHRLA